MGIGGSAPIYWGRIEKCADSKCRRYNFYAWTKDMNHDKEVRI
jgi:hypothetical protein